MEKTELTYEAAMQRLDVLARQMEAGDIAIDELAVRLKEAQQLIAFAATNSPKPMQKSQSSCKGTRDWKFSLLYL